MVTLFAIIREIFERLDLSRIPLTTATMRALGRVLPYLEFAFIRMWSAGSSIDGVSAIFIPKRCATLRSSHNQFRDQGGVLFFENLPPGTLHVNVGYNAFTARALAIIAPIIAHLGIQGFEIAGNRYALTELIRGLQNAKALTLLNLANNSLRFEGALELAQLLSNFCVA